jgi:mono/diheme cytochrome c family protein
MKAFKTKVLASALFLGSVAAGPLGAQDEAVDLFDFIPPGGRTIIADAVDAGLPAADLTVMTTERRSSDDWLRYLQEKSADTAGLAGLDEYQQRTLADYLAHNMPLEAAAGPADDLRSTLPRDGRDIALEYCQSCHVITVTVTQDRSKEAWLGTMNKPSHVEIELTPEEREALADYLIINAAIPVDLIPPELLVGGASY